METPQFMERIQWSKRTYALRMLLEFRRPPCIVHIPEGYRGNNEIENVQPGLVVRIQSVFTERRVFARSVDGRVFSIPETFPIKFEVVKKSGKKRKAKRLDEILRNYRPPILVALDRKNNKWNFRNGRMIQSEDSLGTLVLFKAYFEHFARANQLINGVIDRRIFLIPLYLDLDVRLAEGYKNRSRSDYDILMKMLEAAVQSLDYNSYTGLNAILVFDPSMGSVHPLASSRIHSRTNSAPGGENSIGTGATRTPTDEQTTATAKSSLPTTTYSGAGSQHRARRQDTQGRKRARSEDFLLGSILLEQRSDGRSRTAPESKDGSSNGSSYDDVVVDPGESNVGTTGSRSLNRRKGRSAEELQAARSVHSSEVLLTKVTSASLDPLGGGGDSQARRRRNRKEKKQRTSASVDQLNYIRHRTDDVRVDDVRIDDVRTRLRSPDDAGQDGRSGRQEQTAQGQMYQGEGHHQGQTQDEVFDEDNSVSSAESVSPPPLPRSRASRSRNRSGDSYIEEPRTNNRSEDSFVPEPRTRKISEDNFDPEPLHSKRIPVRDTKDLDPHHLIQNTPQATPSSPHPNYHIHINIQSPESPPTDQWPGRSQDLTVHSLVRPSKAVLPTSRSPPPSSGFKDEYGGPPGTLRMGSVARPSHRGLVVDGARAPVEVRSDQHHNGGAERRQAYSMGGGTFPTRLNLNTFRDRNAERDRNLARAFVSSVSCPGPSGFSYQDPVKGHSSTRLSSKVIQLGYAREPTIRDKEIGTLNNRSDLNNHHHHHLHHLVPAALPEVYDANNNSYYRPNFNVGSGINAKYQHNGQHQQARSVTNIEIPAARQERFSQKVRASILDDDRQILRSQRAAVDQRAGRRWVIKNYNNQPPVNGPSLARRNRLAGTIAVE